QGQPVNVAAPRRNAWHHRVLRPVTSAGWDAREPVPGPPGIAWWPRHSVVATTTVSLATTTHRVPSPVAYRAGPGCTAGLQQSPSPGVRRQPGTARAASESAPASGTRPVPGDANVPGGYPSTRASPRAPAP